MANYDASIRVHTKIDNSDIKNAEKEVDKLSKKLEQLHARGNKLEALGVDKQSKQWKALKYDVAQVEGALYESEEALARIVAANADVVDMGEGFEEANSSAKKLYKTVSSGQKKANSDLRNMSKMMIRMMAQMLLFRAFSATLKFVGAGIQNLSQYSDRLNSVLSDMRSESATLKNSLAAAFEPIVTMIIPYITKLISWLNTAMNYLSQFWAVLSGKNTYTRAKKQVVDYAKSVKAASGAAKGALAAFDELNVLNKDKDNNAGGEVTGADAFEEVEVDKSKFEWVDWLRDNLDIILGIVELIGLGFLGWKLEELLLNNLGKITSFFNSTGFKIGILVAGITLLISGFKDMIENGINLKNSIMVIAGTFLTVSAIAGAAIGAMAALVAGLVLAVIADWDNFKQMVVEPLKDCFSALLANARETLDGIKSILRGIVQFVKGVFTADWKLAWTGIKNIFNGIWKAISGTVKLAVNTIVGIINTMVNGLAGAINAVIRAINSINFTVPDWSPIFAGETIGFNIPTLPTPTNIPYLEYGGTVTHETYAKISEGNRKEVVLPLEQHTEWADLLAEKINGSGNINLVVELDGKTVYSRMVQLDRDYARRTGSSAFV